MHTCSAKRWNRSEMLMGDTSPIPPVPRRNLDKGASEASPMTNDIKYCFYCRKYILIQEPPLNNTFYWGSLRSPIVEQGVWGMYPPV